MSSPARFVHHVNELARVLSQPGGKPVHQAVADAGAKLKEIEPPCIETIDEALRGLVSMKALPGPPSSAERETITWRAEQINDLAGLFGLNEMSKAAWSLCELLDLCSDGHANERSAIASHIRSLELLRAGDQVPEEERLAVLDGLKAVLEHFREEAQPVS